MDSIVRFILRRGRSCRRVIPSRFDDTINSNRTGVYRTDVRNIPGGCTAKGFSELYWPSGFSGTKTNKRNSVVFKRRNIFGSNAKTA